MTEPAGQDPEPQAVTAARPDPAAAPAVTAAVGAVPDGPWPGPGGARPDPGAPTAGSVTVTEPQTRRARLFDRAAAHGVPLAAILTVAGVAVAVYLLGLAVYRLRQIVLLVVVAGFVALLLNPLVVGVQHLGDRPALRRWHLGVLTRRATAVGVVTVAAVIVFVALAFAFAYPLVTAIGHLVGHLNRYVASAEKGQGFVGHLVRKYHVAAWVKKNGPKLQSYAKDLAKPALSVTKGAATLVVALAAIFMLVLLTLLEGPKMRAGLLGVIAPRHREQVVRVSSGVARSVTGYMFGNLLTSLVAGVLVFVAMLALGLPYAPLWGLWVALVDFLPMIGGALAGIPAVLFALIAGGVVPAIVLAVVFLVYTQVENHALNPVVMSRTVHISPLLVLVAVLVGAELGNVVGGIFGGFVGTLLAIPVASTLQVLVQEIWRQTRAAEPVGPVP